MKNITDNNCLAWISIIICALFNVFGNIFSKAWYKNERMLWLVIAIICFLLDIVAWIVALYYKIPLIRGNIIFTGIVTLLCFAAGFYFDNEPITKSTICASILILIGVMIAAL